MILLEEHPLNMSYKEPVLYVIYMLLVSLAGSIFTSMYMVYALSVMVIHGKLRLVVGSLTAKLDYFNWWKCGTRIEHGTRIILVFTQVDNGSDLVWDIWIRWWLELDSK